MHRLGLRGVALAALLLGLSGCGLPPALTVVSWALDGVSFASSGKTLGDHALSIATTQDCSLLRFLENEDICRDFKPGEMPEMVAEAAAWARSGEQIGVESEWDAGPSAPGTQIASAAPASDTEAVASARLAGRVASTASERGLPSAKPELGPAPRHARAVALDGAAFAADGGRVIPAGYLIEKAPASARPASARPVGARPAIATVLPAPPPPAKPGRGAASAGLDDRVLVLASFSLRDNADKAAARWSAFDVSVVSAEIGHRTFYRVVTSPLDPKEIAIAKSRLTAAGAGVGEMWSAPLCTGPVGAVCVDPSGLRG